MAQLEHTYFISSTKYKKADTEGYYVVTRNDEEIYFYNDSNDKCRINGLKIISPDNIIYVSINDSESYSMITPSMPQVINALAVYKIKVKNPCRLYFEGLGF